MGEEGEMKNEAVGDMCAWDEKETMGRAEGCGGQCRIEFVVRQV